MIRIGIIDLDTSHPKAWIPIIRETGLAEVVGVSDAGDVRDPEYVAAFAKENDIPHVYATPEQMAPEVDAAIILGCNWDRHVSQAIPFIELGKPVFIDKPVAGSVAEIKRLEALVDEGADVIGGSAIRYAPQVEAYRTDPGPEGIYTLFATCPSDLFHYGIHSYELVSAMMGPGMISVQHVGGEHPAIFHITYADGRRALVQLQTPVGRAHMVVSHKGGVDAVNLSRKDPYGPLVRNIADHFAGKKPFPTPIACQLECCRAAIAGKVSMRIGRAVRLNELADNDGYNGFLFARAYRAQQIASQQKRHQEQEQPKDQPQPE